MIQKITRHLNVCYYGFYFLAILAAVVMWLGVMRWGWQVIDPNSVAGQTVQYVVILYVICSVAGGLWLFNRRLKKIRLIEGREQQLREYQKWAMIRISLIGVGVVLGIVAFYLLGGYRSMIWLAAISTIGLYFTKPTTRKLEVELEYTDML